MALGLPIRLRLDDGTWFAYRLRTEAFMMSSQRCVGDNESVMMSQW
jgi:hypothetical protein